MRRYERGSTTTSLLSCLQAKKILDIGCGPGVTFKSLVSMNQVTGIDIVKENLISAMANGYYATKLCNLEEGVPFPDDSFDIVLCADILEHVFNTEFLFQETIRVLKKEGDGVFCVPNHNFLNMRIRFLLGKGIKLYWHNAQEWNYWHIRFFTYHGWYDFLDCQSNIRIAREKHITMYILPTKIRLPNIFGRICPTLFAIEFVTTVQKSG